MSTISILGPAGTFADIAAQKYINFFHKDYDIHYYPTIAKSFNAIGNDCELGIIPLENTIDGYVQRSLDLLVLSDLHIIHEIVLPIKFAFVANAEKTEDIKKVYVQFKSAGQCANFLEQFDENQIVITESNGMSLQHVLEGKMSEGAIIPHHSLEKTKKFPLIVEDVTDFKNNQTRFIVLAKNEIDYDPQKEYKTTITITDVADKPGALSLILQHFAEYNINLTSIMSRPTKRVLGKYYFFIDIKGHYQWDEHTRIVLNKIREDNTIKIAGSYYTI